mgnify:CR=1 FL=1
MKRVLDKCLGPFLSIWFFQELYQEETNKNTLLFKSNDLYEGY